MPLYEYRCERGHTFDVTQRMSDDPITSCTVCGAPCHRVFHPVAVHFKGSGFYTTDYGRKAKSGAGAADDSGGKSPSDSDSGGKAATKESSGEKSGSSSSGSSSSD
jgi:putative FmdB family regulatory protein